MPCWSEQVHYISIKQVPYITQVHCQDIMHVSRTQFTIYNFYKRNKKLVPRTLLSYILSTWDFLRTLKKFEKHLPVAHASLKHFSCVLE